MPDIPAGVIDGGTHIHPGTINLPSFASTIRPPTVVDVLPTLPDDVYPEGSLAFLTSNGKLYRNVADVWTASIASIDIVADWLTAGAISVGAIGADELAAGAVQAEHVMIGGLTGEHLGGGLLRVSAQAGFLDGIQIVDSITDGLLAQWDESGLKIIDPADANRYVLLDAGELKFTTDAGATFPTAVTPEGINASAINFGAAPGGHNLILNSSFELADYVAASSSITFTDATKWTAAVGSGDGRITALENIVEGASLTIQTATFL